MPFRWPKEEGCGRQHLALCVGTGMTMDWGAAFRYNIKNILVLGWDILKGSSKFQRE